MQTLDDLELLREYTVRNSEEAFATLVSRHVNLVYSVALRHVGNSHQAEEITQAVFVVLARKAGSLRPGTVVAGWLFHAARLTASNFLRNEIRRTRREQEAYMQSTLQETATNGDWQQIAPLLDGAIASLGETDRNAIVLRYLEGKDLKQVGAALGTGEEAAKKRVSRAVEKLRGFFVKRGVLLSGAALTAGIAANSAQAAPAGLATSAAALAVVKGATAGTSTLALIKGTLKLMAWTKIKMAAVAVAALLLVVGGGITLAQIQTHTVAPATSDGITAEGLVKMVKDKYASLTSYRDTGTSVQVDHGTNKGTFNIRLGRPNFYRVEWQMDPFTAFKSAAWSTGEGDFSMPLASKNYYKLDKPSRALAMAAAGSDIPMIFFNTGPGFLLRGKEISRGPDEKIGEVDCRVLVNVMQLQDGASTYTVCVGKEDGLIHQWRMETKVTTAGAAKGMPVVITMTETHENITVNEPVKKEDFAYQVPEGRVLSELPKPAGQPPR